MSGLNNSTTAPTDITSEPDCNGTECTLHRLVTSQTQEPYSDFTGPRSIIYIIIGLIGLVGNTLVIVVIIASKRMKKCQANIYLINQSVIDLLGSVFLIAASTNRYDSSGHSTDLWGQLYCRVWEMRVPMWSMFLSSTYNLLAMTLERYLQVIHPLWHKASFGRRQMYITLAVVWLIGPVYNLPLTGLTSGVSEVNGTCLHMTVWPNDEIRIFCGVLTFLVEFIIPLLVLLFTYTRMIHRIRSKVHPTPVPHVVHLVVPGHAYVGPHSMILARRNILKTMTSISICFILCWSSNQIYFFLYNIGYPTDFESPFYHFTIYAAFANGCLNPLVYAAQYNQFKEATKKLFCRRNQAPILVMTSHDQAVVPAVANVNNHQPSSHTHM